MLARAARWAGSLAAALCIFCFLRTVRRADQHAGQFQVSEAATLPGVLVSDTVCSPFLLQPLTIENVGFFFFKSKPKTHTISAPSGWQQGRCLLVWEDVWVLVHSPAPGNQYLSPLLTLRHHSFEKDLSAYPVSWLSAPRIANVQDAITVQL